MIVSTSTEYELPDIRTVIRGASLDLLHFQCFPSHTKISQTLRNNNTNGVIEGEPENCLPNYKNSVDQ